MKNIGEQIVKYRARKGISQVKFAEISGISVPTIKLLERGKTNVRPTTIVKIMDIIHPESSDDKK